MSSSFDFSRNEIEPYTLMTQLSSQNSGMSVVCDMHVAPQPSGPHHTLKAEVYLSVH